MGSDGLSPVTSTSGQPLQRSPSLEEQGTRASKQLFGWMFVLQMLGFGSWNGKRYKIVPMKGMTQFGKLNITKKKENRNDNNVANPYISLQINNMGGLWTI